MITLAKLKKLNTIEDLEGSGLIGELDIEISHRGGHLGYSGQDVSQSLDIPWHLMPRNVGAYVNYLGGGLRGSVCTGGYSEKITGKKKELLDELLAACARAYMNAENDCGLNNDEYPDGETNWEAQGTKAIRTAGVKSYPGF